jgi:phytol kinase
LIFVSFTFEHSASADARYIAAIVPLANLLRLLIYGLKVATNEGLVNAVSREGRPE